MRTFYTVDRSGRLSEGLVIDLKTENRLEPPELKEHVSSIFSEGLSEHGFNYLVNPHSQANEKSAATELFFEYVRRSFFPHIRSRFQCLFACETLPQAQTFKSTHGNSESKIFEVSSSTNYFVGNMSLLNNAQSALFYSFRAHEYWRGNVGQISEQFWEVLLELPVTIGRQVG